MRHRKSKDSETVMDAAGLAEAIEEISLRASEAMDFASGGFCVVGIKTRGEKVARRMAELISKKTGAAVPLGVLDITLYRDDIGRGLPSRARRTEMPFSVDGLNVLVVDDVIFTGRTARAAIEAIGDYGRPACVRLATVADRGGREFPIQPDFCAIKISPGKTCKVLLKVMEIDGVDGLFVEREKSSEKKS